MLLYGCLQKILPVRRKLWSKLAADDNWEIAIDKIYLDNNSVVYHNTAMPVTKGFDYNHLEAKHINFSSQEKQIR